MRILAHHVQAGELLLSINYKLLIMIINYFNSENEAGCEDDNPSCPGWGAAGECKANPGYMLSYCQATCGTCPADTGGRWIITPHICDVSGVIVLTSSVCLSVNTLTAERTNIQT